MSMTPHLGLSWQAAGKSRPHHSEVSRHLRAQLRAETGGHSLSRSLLSLSGSSGSDRRFHNFQPNRSSAPPQPPASRGMLLPFFYPVLLPQFAPPLLKCGARRSFCPLWVSGNVVSGLCDQGSSAQFVLRVQLRSSRTVRWYSAGICVVCLMD